MLQWYSSLNFVLYEIKVKIEERSPTLEEYNALRNAIGWWETEQMSTKRALSNSLYSVVALEENKIVGGRCTLYKIKQ